MNRTERIAVLNSLFDAGLTFADCVNAYAPRQQSESKAAVIARARELHEDEGKLEFDDHVIVSGAERGNYVMAWVWVDDVSADDQDDKRTRTNFDRILAETDPRTSTAAAQIAAAAPLVAAAAAREDEDHESYTEKGV